MYFDGRIDEVRIYNRAVTADKILQIYDEYDLVSDLDSDGNIDLNDFAYFAGFWQNTQDCEGDLTCDCFVDIDDLMILIEEWLR